MMTGFTGTRDTARACAFDEGHVTPAIRKDQSYAMEISLLVLGTGTTG
jgi:hypothetical protein